MHEKMCYNGLMKNVFSLKLNDSITLIGPPCVGKSLISQELSATTGLPVVSIDMLRFFVASPLFSVLEKNINDFKTFEEHFKFQMKTYFEGLPTDEKESKQLEDTISEIYQTYVDYHNLLGDFDKFIEIYVWMYEDNEIPPPTNENYSIALATLFNNLMLSEILSRLDRPVIFDMPCYFGWEIPMPENNSHERYLSIEKTNAKSKELKSQVGTVVYLEPGEDYGTRAKYEKSKNVSLLLNNLESYYDGADIVVSTSGEFFEPEANQDAFVDREIFNQKAQLRRTEIKNNGEIANICDQILMMTQQLANSKG